MNFNKETKILLLSLAITLGLVGGGIYYLFKDILPGGNQVSVNISNSANNNQSESRISAGEISLTPGDVSVAKRDGIAAFKSGKYEEAVNYFQAALQSKKNDPETLIYLNNAKIGNKKSYSIAVSIPLATEPNFALEVLRGVAQAQNEINLQGGIKNTPLKVVIASDDDRVELVKDIAQNFVKNSEILGVVGHFASDATLAAGEIYNSQQLVAISPTSSAVKISNFSPYVFRTVPSDFMAARALANYMTTKLNKKKAAIFYNSQSGYSQSLKSEFVSAVSLAGGEVSHEFDMSKPDFSAAQSIAQAQGVEVLMLAANSQLLDKGLQVIQVNQRRLPLLAGDGFYALKTLEISQGQGENMVLAVPWHLESNPGADFPQKSRQLWDADVNWRTALSYDAARALITAIETNPSRQGVQQALKSGNFAARGASGELRFANSGDRNAPVQLVQVKSQPNSRSRTGYDFELVRN
ncbi:ABC transporter substrate-binding protein [Calothrix sp. 336/3]|uniref:ABC transporter substrate-binding protein n=1 Tax=Calothrix sp. 336/3 TaxID=1337936 RepID=UPI0004E3FB44|nr:ABC transporter substrate-binding protein [Calothrix sp. 336/3]AKG23451.1 receptor ligand binding family protein [Calothrix sp. 336/3]